MQVRAIASLMAALSLAACVDAVLIEGGPGGGGSGAGAGVGGAGGGLGGAGGSGGSGGAPTCGCEELDVIIALDNTDSFGDHVQSLVQVFLQLGNYIDAIASRACSFHFAVVTSTPQENNPEPCQVLGAFSRVNASGESCNMLNGKFATEEDDLVNVIPCLVQPGTFDDGGERLIDAVATALSDPTLNGPGGCNEGFFRPEAPLLILAVSDIDDIGSSGQPTDWFATVTQLNLGDPSRVGTMAIIPPAADLPCAGNLAPRLHAFLDLHQPNRHASADLCNLTATEVKTDVEALADTMCPLP